MSELEAVASVVGSIYDRMRSAETKALSRLAGAVTWQKRLRGLKPSRSDIRLLRAVSAMNDSDSSIKRIVATLGVTKEAALRTIKVLEAHKLLTRERSLTDERVAVVTLTGLGRDVVERVDSEIAQEVARGLGDKDLENLILIASLIWSKKAPVVLD